MLLAVSFRFVPIQATLFCANDRSHPHWPCLWSLSHLIHDSQRSLEEPTHMIHTHDPRSQHSREEPTHVPLCQTEATRASTYACHFLWTRHLALPQPQRLPQSHLYLYCPRLAQVDQGLNIRAPLPGGKAFGLTGGLYNRMLASYTKFMQLPFLPKLTEDDVWIDRKVWRM